MIGEQEVDGGEVIVGDGFIIEEDGTLNAPLNLVPLTDDEPKND